MRKPVARLAPPPLRLDPIVERPPAQAVLEPPAAEAVAPAARPPLIPGSVSVVPDWFEPPAWR